MTTKPIYFHMGISHVSFPAYEGDCMSTITIALYALVIIIFLWVSKMSVVTMKYCLKFAILRNIIHRKINGKINGHISSTSRFKILIY